jgi:sec-independent protein translocase protein TatA
MPRRLRIDKPLLQLERTGSIEAFSIRAAGRIDGIFRGQGACGTGRMTVGSFSIWHWLIVLAVVLLLFGRGKIPELMGDVAKGIKNFKKGMSDEENTAATAAQERRTIDNHDGEIVTRETEKSRL